MNNGIDKARQVHADAVAALDEREADFLRDMLANTDVAGVEEADLETLRDAYKDNADEIWLSDDLDDGAHEASDYYEGYVAGARMVLGLVLETWGIEPVHAIDYDMGADCTCGANERGQ